MAYTDTNSEDRLVQNTFAEYLETELGWDSVYAWNNETFGPDGTLGRADTREAVLVRDLRSAVAHLNPSLPDVALDEAVRTMTRADFTRGLLQHNQEFYAFVRDGVPVSYRDAHGVLQEKKARVIDFKTSANNRFLAVRELKLTGLRTPGYNRRADLVCFVNGLPLVFIELKAVYRNIREGFDGNLRDYMDENVIAHAFHHNAFLIVSNGHRARYGSITSGWEHFTEWKRLEEEDTGSVDAEVLLNGMLAHDALLDMVENFILFDASKPGKVRKIIARNHQVHGVNRSVASVLRQEELKREFPPGQRLQYKTLEVPLSMAAAAEAAHETDYSYDSLTKIEKQEAFESLRLLEYAKPAHPDLGKLGVFWHTQGSGKSYSMAFFTEKVRRRVSAKFTFLLMTDRNDLDNQIFRTFAGCGVADDNTARAGTGEELKQLLHKNHRYIFSLIHKFNQDVDPSQPYSMRDDIIVISDEAHRTQAGKLARNMRLALPNASFIGFTGTPLFKHDHLTEKIFGGYISRYDFKRSEEDGATVKLVYENRGEKLGIAKLDLNDRIAAAVAKADLNPDQDALLQKLLGQDYEVITADDRLDKLADDFVEHCTTRWQSGKSMLVCIDKITCARMYQRITPRWRIKLAEVQAEVARRESESPDSEAIGQRGCCPSRLDRSISASETAADEMGGMAASPSEYSARGRTPSQEVLIEDETAGQRGRCPSEGSGRRDLEWLRGQADWLKTTLVQIIISEGQNEVADFKKWGFDIIPHRALMKQGFETPDGKRMDVETAFKTPDHPFRIAIVCAMWLTGFDVECLSALYIDKPMKAHTLMQAIARANRIYPGKDFGLIVDYNGLLKSLREALAQYALGDDAKGGEEDIVDPIEERVKALLAAIEEAEKHLRACGFDPLRLIGAKGFTRIAAIADGTEAVINARDEGRRRFEILARIVFNRFKALAMEPAARLFADRHDNIEVIYKKLQERRDTADVTDLLKELHRIVNEAIRAAEPGDDQMDGKLYDLSTLDLEKLRDEFSKKAKRKATALADICQVVEKKLAQMLAQNPKRMDYYKKYSEIIADYNHDKDRVTIEETFARLMALAASMDAESRRAAEEGLSEEEYALFCILQKEQLTQAEREKVKLASRGLYSSLRRLIAERARWTEKEQTQAEVETLILDHLFTALPSPPFSDDDKQAAANEIYQLVWQQSASGALTAA